MLNIKKELFLNFLCFKLIEGSVCKIELLVEEGLFTTVVLFIVLEKLILIFSEILSVKFFKRLKSNKKITPLIIYISIISEELLLFQGENMLSKNLKNIRNEKKLGIRELERISGVANSTIINIEKGKYKNPTIDTVSKLAKALNITIDELVYEKKE